MAEGKRIPESEGEDIETETDPLEKSWKCLRDFDRSHCGRLDGNLESEIVQWCSIDDDSSKNTENGLRSIPDSFPIPELPGGTNLTMKILSTWGDPFYVGLNGIEIFTSTGLQSEIIQIDADPKDMTVMPQFRDDPRALINLIDGVYVTRDDAHLWLAPFKNNDGGNNISIIFPEPYQIAMIRIWNYNKSRIHSFRGVRDVEILLDNRLIFKGEIAKATGTLCSKPEELSDTILFTTDDETLEKLAINDKYFFGETQMDYETTKYGTPADTSEKRPPTGQLQAPRINVNTRTILQSPSKLTPVLTLQGTHSIVKGTKFILELCQNWGAPDVIGLNGIQLLDRHGRPCILVSQMLSCNQKQCDQLGRLINDRNFTLDEVDIWLCKCDNGIPVRITIRLPHTLSILGVRLWNYNRSFEMSYAGVSLVNIYGDDNVIVQNVSLVKAPGNLYYNFYQDIVFGGLEQPSITRSIETGGVTGFVFQIQLLSTWGDEFYVGLNGIELLNEKMEIVKLEKRNIAAYPESVNILCDLAPDVRTVDKLIDSVNDTTDVNHMWLAPILLYTLNRVYIIFDKCMSVSAVRFWNYTKTPCRGARHITILVDDVIVQSCEIAISKSGKTVSSLVPLTD